MIRRNGWLAAIPLVAFPYAFYRMYDHFNGWDDEGALLLTVRQMMERHRLFDDVFTGYGPVYFAWQWLIRALLALPATHDSARAISLALWLAATVCAACAVWRLTKSRAITLLASIVVFQLMNALANEPGHPQDLVTFANAGLLASVTALGGGGLGVAAIAGVCLGAMGGTKGNVGFLYGLAFTIIAARAIPNDPLRRLVRTMLWIGALALPTLLMWPHIHARWAQAFIAIATAGVLNAIAVDSRIDDVSMSGRQFVVLAVAAAATLLVGLAPFLMTGSTLNAWLQSTIVQNLQVGEQFFFPIEVKRMLAVPALMLCGGLLLGVERQRAHPVFFAVLRIGVGTSMVAAVLAEQLIWVYTVMPAAIWLLVPQPGDEAPDRQARLPLAWVSALGLLYSYPVAGSQVRFTCTALVIAAAVLVADGLRSLAGRSAPWPVFVQFSRAALAVVAVASIVSLTLAERATYSRNVPLNLAGATSVRLPASEAAMLQQVSQTVVSRCRSFLSMPGLYSFHFWTGLAPVTTINADNWMATVPVDLQRRVIEDARTHGSDCVIFSPRWLGFWQRGQDLSQSPLVHYIDANYSEVWRDEDYRLLMRKP